MVSTAVASIYLKIASASIFGFDYLQTLPAEIRLYKKQKGFLRLSIACWLLIAVRYLGMLALLLIMIGQFASFTLESCKHFQYSVPIMKVLAAVAAQAVFIFRTYAICNRNRNILYFLLIFGGLLGVGTIIAPLAIPRTASLGPTGNCNSNLSKGSASWVQYACQVVFDVVILGLTMHRLFRGIHMRFMFRSEFTKTFWESRISYFIAVTIMNILNLIFFVHFNKSNHVNESTLFATLGIAVTAIFSAHVILDLHEVGTGSGLHSTSGPPNIPTHASGTYTTTYRNGEIIERRFHSMPVDVERTGGIFVGRRESDRTSLNSWERRQDGVKIESEAM